MAVVNRSAVCGGCKYKQPLDKQGFFRTHFMGPTDGHTCPGSGRTIEEADKLRSRPEDQPLPIKNDNPIIHRLVQEDLEKRLALGIQRYGQPLQAHNGRDPLQDLYEELLDAAVYAKQALVERAQHPQITLDSPPEPQIDAVRFQTIPSSSTCETCGFHNGKHKPRCPGY